MREGGDEMSEPSSLGTGVLRSADTGRLGRFLANVWSGGHISEPPSEEPLLKGGAISSSSMMGVIGLLLYCPAGGVDGGEESSDSDRCTTASPAGSFSSNGEDRARRS